MARCGQCGKTAIVQINDVPLCVDCNLKFEQAQELYIQRERAELDHLADQMEYMTGVSGAIPRYGRPQRPVQTGPVTFNNIHVDRSIVGAINTGAIAKLDVAMTGAHNMGGRAEELATALRNLTQAVLDSAALQIETKNEIIEDLAFILEQIGQKGPGVKQSGPVMAILERVNSILGTASDLSTVWTVLRGVLGLGG